MKFINTLLILYPYLYFNSRGNFTKCLLNNQMTLPKSTAVEASTQVVPIYTYFPLVSQDSACMLVVLLLERVQWHLA